MRITLTTCLTLGLAAVSSAQQNLLLIIADDLGPNPGNTPNIDALAQQGVLFRNAYSNPVCSTSRATMLTGRYGWRTGVGRGIGQFNDFELSVDEVSLADILPASWAKGAVGKWHMQSDPGADPLLHPLLLGFDHYSGGMDVFPGVFTGDFTNFVKNVNGVTHIEPTYATTDEVNDAIQFIGGQGSAPWFLWLAFHAPHAPFHKPPAPLPSFNLPPIVQDDVPLHVKAMIEAMDTEIGRLFASVNPAVLADTLIIFIGDNGTDKLPTTAPFNPNHAKKTIYEGGINVPLIVAGPGVVQGAECAGLVNTTDIFATLADVAGVPHPTGADSVSLVPYFSTPSLPSLRDHVSGEYFSKNGWGPYEQMDRAIRGERYKLLRWHDPFALTYAESFFDLQIDLFEANDLLLGTLTPSEQAAYERLSAALDSQYETWQDMGDSLAGTNGPPQLRGIGNLAGGDPFVISLTGALENAFTMLFYGIDTQDAIFKGGVLVPNFLPPGAEIAMVTNGQGDVHLWGLWPTGIPSLLPFYIQAWTLDPGAIKGVSATNALRAIQAP